MFLNSKSNSLFSILLLLPFVGFAQKKVKVYDTIEVVEYEYDTIYTETKSYDTVHLLKPQACQLLQRTSTKEAVVQPETTVLVIPYVSNKTFYIGCMGGVMYSLFQRKQQGIETLEPKSKIFPQGNLQLGYRKGKLRLGLDFNLFRYREVTRIPSNVSQWNDTVDNGNEITYRDFTLTQAVQIENEHKFVSGALMFGYDFVLPKCTITPIASVGLLYRIPQKTFYYDSQKMAVYENPSEKTTTYCTTAKLALSMAVRLVKDFAIDIQPFYSFNNILNDKSPLLLTHTIGGMVGIRKEFSL